MSALVALAVASLVALASASPRTGSRIRARARLRGGAWSTGRGSGSHPGAGDRDEAKTALGRAMADGARRVRAPTGRDDLDHALVLETVARPLRAGTSLRGAIEEALVELPPHGPARDLDRAMAAVRAGAPLVSALERWSTSDSARGRVIAGTALVLAAELGGAPGRTLSQAAAGLRDRAGLAREVRALSTQARASATVMVVGPPVFLGFASTVDRRLVHTLVATPPGLGCLLGGALLDVVGAAWMAHLVRRVS